MYIAEFVAAPNCFSQKSIANRHETSFFVQVKQVSYKRKAAP